MSNAVHADAPRGPLRPPRSRRASGRRAADQDVMYSDEFAKSMGSQLGCRLAGKDVLDVCMPRATLRNVTEKIVRIKLCYFIINMSRSMDKQLCISIENIVLEVTSSCATSVCTRWQVRSAEKKLYIVAL
ncbi:hypothetical protein EVAR_32626_1 [Eumeta japonica]|uniref:Uncharacterized protein n=1 Tax=Eumeta variegata TaxID=151549 RepID=A0A4C1WGU2_EUMVA|nr:hypothetical protein EVAR_32626_1 [Eumeta japonica]